MVPNPFGKPGARERATIEKIVTRKIQVSDTRLTELEALKTRLQSTTSEEEQVAPMTEVMVVYITPPVIKESSHKLHFPGDEHAVDNAGHSTPIFAESGMDFSLSEALGSDLSLAVQEVTLPENGWKVFKKRLGRKTEVQLDVIVMVIDGDVLSDMAKTVIATSMLQSVPVAIFALPGCTWSVEEEAFAYSGSTWPVFRDAQQLVKYVQEEIALVKRLRDAISANVSELVSPYRKVNPLKHGVKRAAVALVPFGVNAVNVAGMVRLCGRMMVRTGMAGDRESQKAVAALGALTTGAVMIIDEVGDIYQYAIYGTVLSEFAASTSLEAAAQTLTLADAFLLGSVTLVTGAVSAVGAYFTRPGLVDTLAAFLANLQLMYLLNVKMRRQPIQEGATDHKLTDEEKLELLDSGEISDEEKLRLLKDEPGPQVAEPDAESAEHGKEETVPTNRRSRYRFSFHRRRNRAGSSTL